MQSQKSAPNSLIHEVAKKNTQQNNLLIVNKNLQLSKTKEADELSVASSMHFTVVNGVSGPCEARKPKGLCNRSQQVSVLIVTMSLIFLVMLLGTVLLMESKSLCL